MFGKESKRVRDLEEALHKANREIVDLKSDFKRLALECDDLYEKVRRALGRISKRHALEKQEAEPNDAIGPVPERGTPEYKTYLRTHVRNLR